MDTKKKFKIISEDKGENIKSQEEIILSEQEKDKISHTVMEFFSAVKTLLREGAVLIDDSKESEHSDEETFLDNPTLKNEKLTLHSLAFKSLPKERANAILDQIKGVKMSEDYDFSIESKQNLEAINFVSEKISTNLKEYSKELPKILEERAEKIKALIEARPEIKKYLEKKK
jgi:hypothetical protein